MALRVYIALTVAPNGTGVKTATYRSALFDLIRPLWSDGTDGRVAQNGAGAWLLIVDVTPAQHTTLIADPRVTYLPFERADSSLVHRTDLWTEVSAANRTAIGNALEANHIPTQAVPANATCGQVVRWIRRRFMLRNVILKLDDWTEGLDTLVSAIPLAKRQRMASALEARGIDTSVIRGADTIRQAIRKVLAQDESPFFRGT